MNSAKTRLFWRLNGADARSQWVNGQLLRLPAGSRILDAGAGSQPFRRVCDHLKYYAQDFGSFKGEARVGFSSKSDYEYGILDYECDITDIPERDGFFDAVLCTEVLEHLPHPARALEELARVLRPGGNLILTLPSHSMRHFDPYYFSAGYSDNWLRQVLGESGFTDIEIVQNGDYYKFVRVELLRLASIKRVLLPLLAPVIMALSLIRETDSSRATAGLGYFVTASLATGSRKDS